MYASERERARSPHHHLDPTQPLSPPRPHRTAPTNHHNETDADDSDLTLNALVRSREQRPGKDCPYLDTINRNHLDFDFEKCCSISLSHVNVYACLVCGVYFQGRGPKTHAYAHALEANHHMFMKFDDMKVYCLPEDYEVQDASLADIRAVLQPTFTPSERQALDTDKSLAWRRALDGTDFMPGLVGLNNLKANDYATTVIQVNPPHTLAQ